MSESLWPFRCAYCGQQGLKPVRDINRAEKRGARLFCNRACTGLARRANRTEAQRKALKSAYDAERRESLRDRLKAEKASYHKRTYDPVKAAKERKAKMPRHVEYCRRPEYRKWKAQYDQKYRSQREFGSFGEAAIILNELNAEIASRATRTEIYASNGTLNKWLQRRRDYERQTDRR